jgi:hypothetical protein
MVVMRRIVDNRGLMMRIPVMLALTAGLAACTQSVPDSGAGVGFQDYNSYLREQSAAAPRAQTPVTQVAPFGTAVAPAPAGGFSPDLASAAIDRASGTAPVVGAPLSATTPAPVTFPDPLAQPSQVAAVDPNDPNRPRGNAPSTIQAQSGEMVHNNSGISDEQDFAAVAQRETIESDAERIARNKAQYTVIQPTAVPERSDMGPNIVQFALSTTHNPGAQVYRRSSLRMTDPQTACARYGSPDLAQQAFLEAGGPERDRRGLDPDGDGFACDWDPRPFRLQ